jgi:hypothetical protein
MKYSVGQLPPERRLRRIVLEGTKAIPLAQEMMPSPATRENAALVSIDAKLVLLLSVTRD